MTGVLDTRSSFVSFHFTFVEPGDKLLRLCVCVCVWQRRMNARPVMDLRVLKNKALSLTIWLFLSPSPTPFARSLSLSLRSNQYALWGAVW